MVKEQILLPGKDDKLCSKWKGSYKVVVILHPNAYVLVDENGKKLKNTLNAEHLKNLFA